MRRTDVLVAVMATAAFVLLTVLVMVGWAPLAELDRSVSARANRFAGEHPGWVQTMKVITHAAGPLTWRLLMLALGVWLLVRREVSAGAFTLAAIVVGGVLSAAIKVGVDRTRPVAPHPFANALGMSFPSGHSSTAVLACGTVLLLVLPKLRGAWRGLACALAVAVPLAVGYTRIGLDVHWTSDIVGGWLLGIAVLAGAHAVTRPVLRRDQPLGSLPVSR